MYVLLRFVGPGSSRLLVSPPHPGAQGGLNHSGPPGGAAWSHEDMGAYAGSKSITARTLPSGVHF